MATLQYWQGTMATLQYLSLIPTKCPSLRPHKRSRMSYRDSNLLLVRASLEDVSLQPSYQGSSARREVLVALGALAANTLYSRIVLANQVPKGYKLSKDKFDGYSFVYPFGWQEVVVRGQDITYKDVIEPLESASVTLVPTDKTDIHDYGPPEQVAETLISKVLTPPSQKAKLLNVKERSAEGKNYYVFEFVSRAPNFVRHALGTVAIGNGKLYALTTGANERRWQKMEEKLHAVVDSFTVFNV
eukprot:TRINITY_DN3483_c0_g1_i4.p1 TRINITY_DN3483_c0_g1~~TRINITY_DN3483_c0_g1_i4.p1  ORF type:complete len:244 (+),score=46.42 TRINITY_DN3483_c0_g1_i4:216-947(+)